MERGKAVFMFSRALSHRVSHRDSSLPPMAILPLVIYRSLIMKEQEGTQNLGKANIILRQPSKYVQTEWFSV
jgi:hypothetical protein